MANMELQELGNDVQAALEVDAGLASRIRSAIAKLSEGKVRIAPADSNFYDDTHAILILITEFLPGWSVSLDGTATRGNGNWTCNLRSSGTRDDDMFLGIGKGPTLPHALLAAFLKAASHL